VERGLVGEGWRERIEEEGQESHPHFNWRPGDDVDRLVEQAVQSAGRVVVGGFGGLVVGGREGRTGVGRVFAFVLELV
jgi:hypothetical protein